MTLPFSTRPTLDRDLRALGLGEGAGVFVHASMKAVGTVIGGARSVVEALLSVVGERGLVAMPGFSTDAYFPSEIDRATCSPDEITRIEAAVPGFDLQRSPAAGMGVIAETLRTWPGTVRSAHPSISVCLNGRDAERYAAGHALAWATGPDTPFWRLRERPGMAMLLIGVGWNRCTALHVAETLAEPKRTKTRRLKMAGASPEWVETPDVADDLGRLFPKVGKAFEDSGAVTVGRLGQAEARFCGYEALIAFAAAWIGRANALSGDRH